MRATRTTYVFALLAWACGTEGDADNSGNLAEISPPGGGTSTSVSPNASAPSNAAAGQSSGAPSIGGVGAPDPSSTSADNSAPEGAASITEPDTDGPGIADAWGDAGSNSDTTLTNEGQDTPSNGGTAPSASDGVTTGSESNGAAGATSGDTGNGEQEGVSGEPQDDEGSAAMELVGTPTHEERATLPAVRQEHGAAALNGEIYVLGGFTPQVTSSVQAYSPDTNTWRDVADFPAEFHHPNVAVVNGVMYVTGFHLGSSLRVADPRSFAYDPVADEWTPRSPLPPGTERGSACVATIDGKIYLFGGASDRTLPDASAYDTELDSWEVLPLMPALREHCLAAAIGGKIYIVSGRSGSIEGVHVESWMYDPETQSYSERAPIPTPRGGAAGGVVAGRLFVLGGEGNPENGSMGIFPQIEAYDAAADAWESFPNMPIPRHGYAAAVVDERIYLPGGATRQGAGAVADHSVFYFASAD